MTQYNFDKTKGQSAIEYLMTYGWMLLVVAIVGGAIFATVQGQCTQSTSGFSGGDVLIENFGIDDEGHLQMKVRNGGSDTLSIEDIAIEGDDAEGQLEETENLNLADNEDIGAGNSHTITVEADNGELFEPSDGCNDYSIDFLYSPGELDDLVTSGTLTDSIDLTDDPSA